MDVLDEFDVMFSAEQRALIELAHAKAARERLEKLCQAVKQLPYDEQVKLFQVLVEELSGS